MRLFADLSSRFHSMVAKSFYRYGIFCSRHPLFVIVITGCIIVTCWMPLFWAPVYDIDTKAILWNPKKNSPTAEFDETFFEETYGTLPVFQVQHYVFTYPEEGIETVSVFGNVEKQHIDSVLYKTFLMEVFEILNVIRNFSVVVDDEEYTLVDFCYLQQGRKRRVEDRVRDCLVVSPLEVWDYSKEALEKDENMFISLSLWDNAPKEVLELPSFQLQLVEKLRREDTLLRQFNHDTVFSGKVYSGKGSSLLKAQDFIVSLFFRQFTDVHEEDCFHIYLKRLCAELASRGGEVAEGMRWKLNCPNAYTNAKEEIPLSKMYFEVLDLFEGSGDFAFLSMSYIIVFLYISFSIGKFHQVKSKYGLGFTAVVTVFCSMTMSVGICTYFNFRTTLMAIEVIPFMVIAIGVENIFVITNSVVATDFDLPVKVRIAEGLSAVGGKILSSLLTELVLFVVVGCAQIPALTEFAVFAIVAVLSDFFLQIMFFTTVLSIDIRRMELSDLHHHRIVSRPSRKSRSLSASDSDLVNSVAGNSEKSPEEEDAGPILFRKGLLKISIAAIFMLVVGFSLYRTQLEESIRNGDSTEEESEAYVDPPFSYWRLSHNRLGIDIKNNFVNVFPILYGSIQRQPPSKEIRKTPKLLSECISYFEVLHTIREKPFGNRLVAWAKWIFFLDLTQDDGIKDWSLFVRLVMALVFATGLFVYFKYGKTFYMSILARRSSLELRRLNSLQQRRLSIWYDSSVRFSQVTMRGHTQEIECLLYDTSRVVSVGLDHMIHVWNLESGLPMHKLDSRCKRSVDRASVKRVVWCAGLIDGILVTGLNNGDIQAWDIEDGSEIYTLASCPSELDFRETDDDRKKKRPLSLSQYDNRHHSEGITCLVLTKNLIVSGSEDHTVRAFKLDDGEWKITLFGHKHIITSVAVTRNSDYVVSGCMDNTIKVHKTIDGECVYTLYGQTNPSTLVIDERSIIASSANHTIRVWDLTTGACIKTLDGHKARISCIKADKSVSPFIVSSALDDTLRVWDPVKGKCLHILEQKGGCDCIAFILHPIIAVGGLSSIKIWDIEGGVCTRKIIFGTGGGITKVNNVLWTGSRLVADFGDVVKIILTPTVPTAPLKKVSDGSGKY
eukprot:Nk52_evm72s1073 gene=Nk52_evmTU72s1073